MPPPELLGLYQDLNADKLRVRRPSRFIFFCGGQISGRAKDAYSLRHYLLSDRRIDRRLKADVVLAEKATQLYRDADYKDLITFEEDIARISAMILLIAESAGSLAELGAFAAIDAIRSNLAVLIQTAHDGAESFIKYGPIEKVRNENEHRVGVYPWRTNKEGKIVKSSINSHVARITRFINDLLQQLPKEEVLKTRPDVVPFFIILWVLHLCQAVPITDLHRYVDGLIGISNKDLRNKLYCMELAGWVASYTYENKKYWFSTSPSDPISKYSFLHGVVLDTSRRKAVVTTAIKKDLRVPRHVLEFVAAHKGALA